MPSSTSMFAFARGCRCWGAIFVTIALVSDGLWSIGAATAHDWLLGSPKRLERMGGASGLAMIGMGAGLGPSGRPELPVSADGLDWQDATTWPAWVTEPIELRSHDPRWLRAGGAEAARLAHLLGDHAAGPVHHIGSTAVRGLVAKPILDLAVASRQRHAAAGHLATALGPQWALVPDGLHPLPIRLLIRVVDGHRHTHLQIIDVDDPHLHRLIGLRDAMREDPAARDAYAAAKLAAADAHADDRQAYTEKKADVIADILTGVGITPAG